MTARESRRRVLVPDPSLGAMPPRAGPPGLAKSRTRHALLAVLMAALGAPLFLATAGATELRAVGRLGLPGVRSMVYSPDSDLSGISTGNSSESLLDAQVIDGETGGPVVMFPPIVRTSEGPVGYGNTLAFSSDGKTVAAHAGDYVSVLDIDSGRETSRLPTIESGVRSLAFSPDGRVLAGGWLSVSLWDLTRPAEHPVVLPHARVHSVAFSPDGATLATASQDSSVKLWDVATLQAVATLAGHTDAVHSIVFDPDGGALASGSGDHTIKLWDIATRREITTLTGHAAGVYTVAFSADGRSLASGSGDHTVKLWDVATGVETATLIGHDGPVVMAAFCADGASLVSGHSGPWDRRPEDAPASPRIRRWDLATRQQVDAFGDYFARVYQLAFSPDGELLATTDGAEDITLWDVVSRRRVGRLDGAVEWVSSLTFSPDSVTLVAATGGGVKAWDVARRQPISTFVSGLANSVAFTPDGRILVTADEDVVLWDVTSGQKLATLDGHPERNTALAVSPDGAVLAAGDADYAIHLWDVEFVLQTARAVGRDVRLVAEAARLSGHTSDVMELTFIPDGGTLVSGSRDGAVRLWDVAEGRELTSLDAGGRSRGIALSPDGGLLASVGAGYNTRLWDVASLQEIATVGGHRHPFIYALEFSPDGTLLASGGEGVLLWGIAGAPGETPAAVDPTGKTGATWAHVKQAAPTPTSATLLPNYPNPFNPETWIPFDLRDDAKVVISIYDASGSIVRRLDLGGRPAGAYRTRGRAAYWDGRDNYGEVVSSGVYFAELVAGIRRRTQRIALRK
jgi:WD40 repeat protein